LVTLVAFAKNWKIADVEAGIKTKDYYGSTEDGNTEKTKTKDKNEY